MLVQQATRPARKMYVGNLPAGCSEGEITHFFNQVMAAAKAVVPGAALLVPLPLVSSAQRDPTPPGTPPSLGLRLLQRLPPDSTGRLGA